MNSDRFLPTLIIVSCLILSVLIFGCATLECMEAGYSFSRCMVGPARF